MSRPHAPAPTIALALALALLVPALAGCNRERPPDMDESANEGIEEETDAQLEEFGSEIELQTEVTADELSVDDTTADVDVEREEP